MTLTTTAHTTTAPHPADTLSCTLTTLASLTYTTAPDSTPHGHLEIVGDGSCRPGGCAGAAIGSDGRWAAAALHRTSGSATAELVGIALGYLLALTTPTPEGPITIRSDNKPLITALNRGARRGRPTVLRLPDAYVPLLAAVDAAHAALTSTGTPVRIQWVRGHADHVGNHAADAVARAVSWEVASGRTLWGGVGAMADRLAVFAQENWESITQRSALDLAMGKMIVAG